MDDRTVVGRALEIIETVAALGPNVTLAELTTRTRIPKPTARRIAEDLVRRRILERSPDGYTLGVRLAELGETAALQNRYAALRPALVELHAQCGGIAWISAGRRFSELTPVDMVCDPGLAELARSAWPPAGTPETLANTAGGRIVLAERPDLLERVARTGWRPATANSPTTVGHLLSALRQIRDLGAAVEAEQSMPGWRCVAAAVADPSGRPAILGLTVPVSTADPARMLRTTIRMHSAITETLASASRGSDRLPAPTHRG